VFTLLKNGHRITSQLIYHNEVGVEAQLFRDGEF
jgi:hypothetical protein